MDGGRELLSGHQEIAVAGEGDDGAFGMAQLGRHRRRQAVAHGAAGRAQDGAETPIAVETVDPDREIAGPVAQDGVVVQALVEPGQNLAHLHRALNLRWFGPGQVIGAGGLRPFPPSGLYRLQGPGGGGKRLHAGVDGQRRLIDPAQFPGSRMDVDKGLFRHRDIDEGIAAGGQLAQPGADDQKQVGVPNPLVQFRVGAGTQIAGVMVMVVVEPVLTAEGDGDGQVVGLGHGPDVVAGVLVPAGAAEDHQRPLRLPQHFPQGFHVFGAGVGLDFGRRRDVHRRGAGPEHVFRQRQDHRPGASRNGQLNGAVEVFGDPGLVVDLADPFRHLAIHAAVVDFLKRFALRMAAGHLADQQHQRRRILERHMDSARRIGGAGGAGDEAHARLPGQLAVGVGHHRRAAFMAADDELDFRDVVKGVEGRKVAFAGDAKDPLNAVGPETLDQNLPARPQVVLRRHFCFLFGLFDFSCRGDDNPFRSGGHPSR